MDWSDLTVTMKFDVLVVHGALLGQTVFLVLWGALPWWKQWVGRALMLKSAALWILFAVNLALFWWMLATDKPIAHAEKIAAATHVLVTVGVWLQVVALGREMRNARRGRRRVTGTTGAPGDHSRRELNLMGLFKKKTPATGWIPHHDPRSDNYLSRDLFSAQEPVRKMWPLGPTLNQGDHGFCVGFAYTCELMAKPVAERHVDVHVAQRFAKNLYYRAKYLYGSEHDPHAKPEGLISEWALNVLRDWGLITEYRWAKSITEVRDAVIAEGPVVIGVTLYRSMCRTNRSGYIKVDTNSEIMGGHELCVTGYDPAKVLTIGGREQTVEAFRIRNSWGDGYGERRRVRTGKRFPKYRWVRTGHAWIVAADLDRLLAHGRYLSNACVPIARGKVDLAAQLAAHPDPLDPPLPAAAT